MQEDIKCSHTRHAERQRRQHSLKFIKAARTWMKTKLIMKEGKRRWNPIVEISGGSPLSPTRGQKTTNHVSINSDSEWIISELNRNTRNTRKTLRRRRRRR